VFASFFIVSYFDSTQMTLVLEWPFQPSQVRAGLNPLDP